MKAKILIAFLIVGIALAAASFAYLSRGDQPTITRVIHSKGDLAAAFKEAPSLQALVAAGKLPTVQERLPKIPLLIQPEEEVGVYGGTWREAMRSKDDHGSFIRTLGYENLVRWNTAWTGVIPNLAQNYEVSPDGREYVFRLREGTRWSDGEPFTSDDIMFWYEDILSNPDLTTAAPAWLMTEGKTVVVEKIDELTVKFKFASPNGLFITSLAHPQGAEPTSYPKHYLKQFLPKYNPGLAGLVAAAGVKDWRELFTRKFGTPGTIDKMDRWQNPELPVFNAWTLASRYGVDQVIVAKRTRTTGRLTRTAISCPTSTRFSTP